MPTYTNSQAGLVQVGDITFGPSEVKVLYQYIDITGDTTGYISLTSHAPYYNPILANTAVTGTDETVVHTLNTYKSSSVRIIYVSGTVNIYLNATANTPAMTIKENITIENRGRILSIHVVFTGAGEILIQENA